MEKKMPDIKLIHDSDALEAEALAWLARLDSSEISEQDWTEFASWLAADPQHEITYEAAKKDWSRFNVLSDLDDTTKMAIEA